MEETQPELCEHKPLFNNATLEGVSYLGKDNEMFCRVVARVGQWEFTRCKE